MQKFNKTVFLMIKFQEKNLSMQSNIRQKILYYSIKRMQNQQ